LDCGNAGRHPVRACRLTVLLQEETYATPENRLDEKVIEFERAVVARSTSLDLTELRKDDPDRWHHFDTYRIVLEAAWSNDGLISPDEARLLAVLRAHLSITPVEHCKRPVRGQIESVRGGGLVWLPPSSRTGRHLSTVRGK
jgi:hypothetical protein